MSDYILEVRNLKTSFFSEEGEIPAVNGVSFKLEPGKTLGIVGESGCGKSVTSMSILRLIPEDTGRIKDGEILFEGKNLLALSKKQMRKVRGQDISMIFQEPMTSLNPVLKIGCQLREALTLHEKMSRKQADLKCIEMLKTVKIPRAEEIMNQFPHNLSGGMRQRVMIAMALLCNPKVLIADEPTTALDVTIQAQILAILKDVQKKFNTAIILITHDLGVIAEAADDVIVMYAGKVVESGTVQSIFDAPKHPYTIGLQNAIPKIGKSVEILQSIPGNVPKPTEMPKGCRFSPRCSEAMDICLEKEPQPFSEGEGSTVCCFKYCSQCMK